jgi:hypothetical protein
MNTPMTPEVARSTVWKGNLSIPSFRREISFIGRTEGFKLYDDLFLPHQPFSSEPSDKSSSPLNPLDLQYPQTGNLNLDFTAQSTDLMKSILAEPREKIGPLPVFDFSTDTVAQSDMLLGALPVIPAARERKSTPRKEPKKEVHVYSKKEKATRVKKFRKKKSTTRNFKKKVRYQCRQKFARSRPRIGGRFVGKLELEAWKLAQAKREIEEKRTEEKTECNKEQATIKPIGTNDGGDGQETNHDNQQQQEMQIVEPLQA